ncbi:MAG: class C sortase [Clostridia bacterium]|nr:class C sortase [Clostridia bacterium]
MKRIVLANIFFIIGLSIVLYPIISKIISINSQTVAITNYITSVDMMSEKEKNDKQNIVDNFNKDLYKNSNDILEKKETSILNLKKEGEILGYIHIPKIHISIPIYEGTSNEVLEAGVGHIKNTSIPCGGINTHSVLVGHTGITNAVIFDNLDKLEIGDKFYINHINNILEYEVSNINTVLPDETESLKIEKNRDLVTLVTCVPKYINTHRLLVTADRVKLQKGQKKYIQDSLNNNIKRKNNVITIIFFIILYIVILVVVIILIRKIKNKF